METDSSTTGFLLESAPALVKNLDGELEALDGRLSAQRAASEQVEQDVAALEKATRAGAEAERCAGGQAQAREQAGALSEQINAAKESAARLAAERETTAHALADLEQVCRDLLCDRASREALVNRYEAEIASLQNQVEEKMGTIVLRCGQTEKRSWQNWKRFRRKNWNWKQNALPRTGRAGRRNDAVLQLGVKWVGGTEKSHLRHGRKTDS